MRSATIQQASNGWVLTVPEETLDWKGQMVARGHVSIYKDLQQLAAAIPMVLADYFITSPTPIPANEAVKMDMRTYKGEASMVCDPLDGGPRVEYIPESEESST